MSSVTQATRDVFGNGAGVAQVSDAWPIANPILYTVLWGFVILAVFVPLSVRQYNKAASR